MAITDDGTCDECGNFSPCLNSIVEGLETRFYCNDCLDELFGNDEEFGDEDKEND